MYKIKTYRKKILADTMTPVSIYQKIRDTFSNSILLESSDYGANDNSYAYVCFNPISSFKVKRNQIIQTFPDNKNEIKEINKNNNVISELNLFSQKFKTSKSDSKFFENGIIGYMNYDAVKHFEKISLKSKKNDIEIPDIFYAFYSNIIIINVFNNEATLLHHSYDQKNNLDEIEKHIKSNKLSKFPFSKSGNITSNLNDNEYLDLVKKGIKHCERGDVFQIVLSRRFKQKFEGDEFNLY
ncbi:anthranilate synthase component I family protein, partial [Flavobacteriaceae bacterium]|nr:anthranilate synthase component I family protein [Flavobacteriaceae bacterium]